MVILFKKPRVLMNTDFNVISCIQYMKKQTKFKKTDRPTEFHMPL